MTAARKRSREEALFTAALAQPADRRAGFLDRACGDEALRARIEALLNAHHEAGTLIGGERPKPAAPWPAPTFATLGKKPQKQNQQQRR